MSVAETFIAELEQEAAATRACLERIPGDQLEWRPHEKSMTIGQLGHHIATAPGGIAQMATQDEVPPPNFEGGQPQPSSTQEILGAFEASLATVKETISKMDDDKMFGTWKMVAGGKELLVLPRAALLRSIMLNHLYHHRGQLTVYLRLLNVPVPSVYGPSADAPPAFLANV